MVGEVTGSTGPIEGPGGALPSSAFGVGPDPALVRLAHQYLDLALAGELDRAVDVVLASGIPSHEVLLKILEPAHVELGRLCETRQVGPEQERRATELTQHLLSLLRSRRKSAVPHGRTVYVGQVGSQEQTVGLELLADLLETAGWAVHRDGGVLDPGDVVERVAQIRPDVLALSVVLVSEVPELRAVVAALRSDVRTAHVPVVVTGRPLRTNPDLVALVGADDSAADSQGVIEACQRASSGTGATGERHVNDVTREMVNPLETMLGLAALLKEDDSLTHRQRGLASRIIQAGSQLMTVLEDLGHGLVVVHGGPDGRSSTGLVDFDELVEALLVRHQSKAAQRDIVMRQIRIPAVRGRVMVKGDISQLERLVDTLLDNAVAVTPASGVITVRVKRADGHVVVAVADEGPPVPREAREAIFDAERATSSTGATDLGPWRGLAVCRRIAEQHGGSISASSDHRGAVFSLDLPLSSTMLDHEPSPDPYPPLSVVRDRQSGPPPG